jgi:DNA-binding transcriptional MocR family regulator
MSSPRSTETHTRYERFKKEAVALDLTRGKPSAAQLDLAKDLATALGPDDYRALDGTDCRNYGGHEGIREARELFGQIFGVPGDLVLAEGSSSLQLMHQTLLQAMFFGVPDGSGPWRDQRPRFVCPVPGYDRHFSVCEHLGIEMVNVDMAEDLDMDAVERLVASDERMKGMWLVPKYGNPTGMTLSPETVRRLARMKTAAPDFRIMWDNAYALHDLDDTPDVLANAFELSQEAGTANRFLQYASFSKVTFAGAGLAAMAASATNLGWMNKHRFFMTIGPDKMNQLRHVRFLRDLDGVRAHMKKHAEILRPKFDIVQRVLERELGGTGLATWTKPRGGYFVSLDTQDGRAARVVKLAAEAGVKLTPAGSSFPHKKDPRDRNIRLAPSFPPLAELERAIEITALAVLCASDDR